MYFHSSVMPLFKVGRPSTILGRIVAIIIDSFKCVLGRGLWSHISGEGIEGMPPRIADFNTSGPIAIKPAVVGVVASFLHRSPNPVDSGSCHPMLCVGLNRPLSSKAPTTLAAAGFKVCLADCSFVSTIASALKSSSVSFFCFREDDEAMESKANHLSHFINLVVAMPQVNRQTFAGQRGF